MAGFVRYLAPRFEEVRRRMKDALDEARRKAVASTAHRRIPDIVCSLKFGFDVFVDFAREIGAVTAEEGEALRTRA
jgi:hypothetical protein